MDDLKQLARKIKERQKLVERIVNFVNKILPKFGNNTLYKQHSSHTSIAWYLWNIEGFTFKASYGHTMMGGNAVNILYIDKEVLHVYWQVDVKECVVNRFEETNWVDHLEALMKTPSKIRRIIEERKRKANKEWAEHNKENKEQKRLNEEAKRLGLL